MSKMPIQLLNGGWLRTLFLSLNYNQSNIRCQAKAKVEETSENKKTGIRTRTKVCEKVWWCLAMSGMWKNILIKIQGS